MGDTTEATVRDAATIDVDCESCGQHFTYEQVFLVKAEVRYADPRADAVRVVKKLADQMRDGFGKNDYSKLSWKRCPHCGYTQSWMIKRARISQGLKLFLPPAIVILVGSLAAAILIPDAHLGGEILKYALIAVAAIPVIAVIAMSLAFHPNRGRVSVDKVGRPNITFAVEKAGKEGIQVGNMPGDLSGNN